jgi:hypothetical protein
MARNLVPEKVNFYLRLEVRSKHATAQGGRHRAGAAPCFAIGFRSVTGTIESQPNIHLQFTSLLLAFYKYHARLWLSVIEFLQPTKNERKSR